MHIFGMFKGLVIYRSLKKKTGLLNWILSGKHTKTMETSSCSVENDYFYGHCPYLFEFTRCITWFAISKDVT